jgi:hypothetical protein
MKAHAAVTEDPEILGGTPVMKGTRVPVYALPRPSIPGLLSIEFSNLPESQRLAGRTCICLRTSGSSEGLPEV